MIDISRYLYPEVIITDFKARTKEEAIRALVDRVFQGKKVSDFPLDQGKTFAAVMDREKLQTTGIGNGLAFPHARIEKWGKFTLAMGISKEGIDFNSLDGTPANFVFLLISSTEEPYIILQTMATIIRFVVEKRHGAEMLERILSAGEIIKKFEETKKDTREQILACDIARPVINFVTLDTSIEDATRIMHLNRFDVLPILDENKRYCGEISCLDIFAYGMPDFFKKLNTVAFVKHIDPFEKYFKIKGSLKVKDVYSRDGSTIPGDATLLEIIFQMTVKQKNKLFVLKKDNTLIGIIDRFSIIDKILFF